MIKKSILIWLTIIPLAILNGVLRDKVLAPLVGEDIALPASGILLCLLILAATYLLIPRLGKASGKQYVLMGIVWMMMTIGFEFAIGFFFMETSIEDLIRAYDITTGNLWSLVVLFTAIVPWLSARLRKLL